MNKKISAIYHRVYKRENFEKAAKDLFELVVGAQKESPNQLRNLYVDIMEHKNDEGGFDTDMFELHKFALEFLLQYCNEIHMPLFHVRNDKGQNNDIPEKLEIYNIDEKNDEDNLLIENYSNTEFVYEEDIYKYLKKVSNFLKEYNDLDFYYSSNMNYPYDKLGWLITWRIQMKELIIELVNAFVSGNFYVVSAMSRTLIECYVYIKIIMKEQNSKLLDEWHICETIRNLNNIENNSKIKEYASNYIKSQNIDFDAKWDFYTRKSENENSWLRCIINKKGRITFNDLCKYLEEPKLYKDYTDACDFIHYLSLKSKMFPFAFYKDINAKLLILLKYSFKSIRLFELPNDLKEKLVVLENELKIINNKYSKY